MTDWSDDRLGAAFRARAAAHPMPAGLVDAVVARIQGPTPVRRRGQLALVAGLAAAAAVFGALQLTTVMSPRPSEPVNRSKTANGLPILSVTEAIAVRDLEQSDREIAVRGFYARWAPTRCRLATEPVSPLLASCDRPFEWLTERLEPIAGVGLQTESPTSPAIHPSLVLVDASPIPAHTAAVVEVVVVGHFHDRRVELCPTDRRDACGNTFLVDRIEEVSGAPIGTSTVVDLDPRPPEALQWQPEDVDASLEATIPGLDVLSRVAIAGGRIGDIEPALGTGGLGLIDRPIVWDVTALEPSESGDAPTRQTFLLVDGTDEAYRDDPNAPVRFVPFALAPPVPATPSPAPTAPGPGFENAPREVHGLPIISVSQALARIDELEFDDTELAVRGYYVPPFQPTSCPEHPPDVAPIRMVCPDAFEWLMEEPEQVEDSATHERHPPSGPALNPLVAAEVPFDVPDGWFDAGLEPLPVVVVGHFGDHRSTNFEERKRFVVDALAWRAGQDADESPVLLAQPTDSAVDVLARIDAELGPADDSWASVVDGGKLSSIESGAMARAWELVQSPATWVVRRLVLDAGRPRVETAFTADGSDRVWVDDGGNCCSLATTIDVELGTGEVVEIADYPDQIVGVRTEDLRAASWILREGPTETGTIMIGVTLEGPRNELRVSWHGAQCDRTWHLDWGHQDSLYLWPSPGDALGGRCSIGLRREVILTLDHPIDINTVVVWNGGAGG
jgi:hypothetical protein